MEMSDAIKNPEFWVEDMKMRLFSELHNYMKKNALSQKDLAEELGYTKSYITQILNGNFNHSLHKLAELSLKIGLVPRLEFESINDALELEKLGCLLSNSNERALLKYFNKPASDNDNTSITVNSKTYLIINTGTEKVINKSRGYSYVK